MRAAILAILAACSTADGRRPATATADDPVRADEPASTTPASTEAAVVIELFTSQGCSSCPPADQLLAELAAAPDVIALAFHVDYWNDLGWADPFSRAAFTARQQVYAGDAGRVYTPALVVNGAADVVGSNRRAVAKAIAGARRLPVLPARATVDGAAVRVEATPPDGTTAVVAVYEDGLRTAVPRGENAGATLPNDRVVRALVPLVDRVATFTLDPTWDRARLGAVVLAAGAEHHLVAARRLSLR